MHAYLIVSKQEGDGYKKALEISSKENLKTIDYTLLKIEDAKEIKKVTKFSFSEKTAIIIKDIDNATNEALNAFLKNLEEPNKNLIYILIAKSIDSVLPTIVSRCEVLKISNNVATDTDTKEHDEVQKFIDMDINEKLIYVTKIKDREEAKIFIEGIIKLEHSKKRFNYQEKALKTLASLKANGNVSLQLTAFVVTMNPAYGRQI